MFGTPRPIMKSTNFYSAEVKLTTSEQSFFCLFFLNDYYRYINYHSCRRHHKMQVMKRSPEEACEVHK